jgi:hypothetical protein
MKTLFSLCGRFLTFPHKCLDCRTELLDHTYIYTSAGWQIMNHPRSHLHGACSRLTTDTDIKHKVSNDRHGWSRASKGSHSCADFSLTSKRRILYQPATSTSLMVSFIYLARNEYQRDRRQTKCTRLNHAGDCVAVSDALLHSITTRMSVCGNYVVYFGTGWHQKVLLYGWGFLNARYWPHTSKISSIIYMIRPTWTFIRKYSKGIIHYFYNSIRTRHHSAYTPLWSW